MSIEHQYNAVPYKRFGAGKDLVLIHGWGVNSAIWQDVVSELSLSYRVHLIALPGFGGQVNNLEYSLPAIAESILKHAPKNAVWCGWSLGGLVATYIASEYPERVDKLIQVCTSLKFVEGNNWLGVKKDVFDAFKDGIHQSPKKTLNRFISLQAMGSETVKTDIIKIKALLVNQPLYQQTALIGGLMLLRDVDLREKFKQLTVPCLSLFGQYDSLVPVMNIEAIKTLNPSIQTAIFNNSSHAPFISEKEIFCKLVSDYISGH